MSEAAEPLEAFKTFNEFFFRKLKPSARPIASPEHPDVLVSAADCRLMAYVTVDDATRCWIKARVIPARFANHAVNHAAQPDLVFSLHEARA